MGRKRAGRDMRVCVHVGVLWSLGDDQGIYRENIIELLETRVLEPILACKIRLSISGINKLDRKAPKFWVKIRLDLEIVTYLSCGGVIKYMNPYSYCQDIASGNPCFRPVWI